MPVLRWTRYILWFNALAFIAIFVRFSNYFGTFCIKRLHFPILTFSFLIFLSRFYTPIGNNGDVTLKSGTFLKTWKNLNWSHILQTLRHDNIARQQLPCCLNLPLTLFSKVTIQLFDYWRLFTIDSQVLHFRLDFLLKFWYEFNWSRPTSSFWKSLNKKQNSLYRVKCNTSRENLILVAMFEQDALSYNWLNQNIFYWFHFFSRNRRDTQKTF